MVPEIYGNINPLTSELLFTFLTRTVPNQTEWRLLVFQKRFPRELFCSLEMEAQ